jgi:hypothetical protein
MITGKIQGGNLALADINRARHYPAANTAATQTIAAVVGKRHVLFKIAYSYSAAPTGGRLSVTDGGTTVFDVDITLAGPGAFTLMEPMGINSEMIVTLAAGGVGITGKLQFTYFTRP